MPTPYPKIAKLGTILAVWAHPDDESWCAAGTLAAAVANGQRVVCVTATRGESGVQDETRWPLAELGSIRQSELQKALTILGITEHHWLSYRDGHCHEVSDEDAARQIVPVIEAVKPDSIITFGPDGLTGHTDHQAVSYWTTLALEQSKLAKQPKLYYKIESREWYENQGREMDKRFNIYYRNSKPPLVAEAEADLSFHLPSELLKIKLEALKVQISQTDRMFSSLTETELKAMFAFEGFRTPVDL